MGLDRKASAHDQNDANDPKATSLSAIGPSAPRKAEGSLEAFGEVCHRLRRPTTTATAPDYRLSLNAEERGANGHAGFAQPSPVVPVRLKWTASPVNNT